MNLKKLIAAKNAGFHTKKITVPEWGGITVLIREPSVKAWTQWAETIRALQECKNSEEKNRQRIEAEAKLFASTLCDEEGNVIFEDNYDDLITNYGPIHSRLLNQALELSDISDDPIHDAKKK